MAVNRTGPSEKVAGHADMLFGIALLRRTNESDFNDDEFAPWEKDEEFKKAIGREEDASDDSDSDSDDGDDEDGDDEDGDDEDEGDDDDDDD